MKRLSNLLVIVILFCSISCDDEKGASAPDILTDVIIEIEIDTGGSCLLTLNSDDSASLKCQLTLCCWDIYYGIYTYEKKGDSTGIISVSYNSHEQYNTVLTNTEPIDVNIDHNLKFSDVLSGSYFETSKEFSNKSGSFLINEIK